MKWLEALVEEGPAGMSSPAKPSGSITALIGGSRRAGMALEIGTMEFMEGAERCVGAVVVAAYYTASP